MGGVTCSLWKFYLFALVFSCSLPFLVEFPKLPSGREGLFAFWHGFQPKLHGTIQNPSSLTRNSTFFKEKTKLLFVTSPLYEEWKIESRATRLQNTQNTNKQKTHPDNGTEHRRRRRHTPLLGLAHVPPALPAFAPARCVIFLADHFSFTFFLYDSLHNS